MLPSLSTRNPESSAMIPPTSDDLGAVSRFALPCGNSLYVVEASVDSSIGRLEAIRRFYSAHNWCSRALSYLLHTHTDRSKLCNLKMYLRCPIIAVRASHAMLFQSVTARNTHLSAE